MKSEEDLLKEIKQSPDNIKNYWELAQYYLHNNDKKKLKMFLDAIIMRFYFVTEFLYLRAQIFIEEHEWLKAELDVKRCIELKPDNALFHDTLGVIFQKLEHYERAITAHKKAIALHPNHAGFIFNYAVANDKLGKTNIAKHHYLEIIERFEKHTDAELNLAIILKNEGNYDQAKIILNDAINKRPHFFSALMEMGNIARQEENTAQARVWYEKAQKINPHHPDISFILDSLSGITQDKPPPSHVTALFDSFAETFEDRLVKTLDYQGPQQIFSLLRPFLGGKISWLDLGAGTGLLAKELKPYCNDSVAVDLSAKMLQKAKDKELYDTYICADLVLAMSEMQEQKFDLISAADVFVYIGNLEDVFSQAARLLNTEGLFIFSIEDSESVDKDYCIKNTMRYGHDTHYIERLGNHCGFALLQKEQAVLRTNKGQPIAGHLYLLKKEK